MRVRRSRHHLARRLRRFAREDGGATAVEFGLICMPLMLMVFGVIELALVFLVSTTLETATEEAGRRIRTGEFQQGAASTKADFKAMVCGGMTWLSTTCDNDLYIDVQTFPTFNALANAPPQDPSKFKANTTCWSPGQPTDIELVRVYYQWKLFTPLIDNALENMGGGSGMRLISTTTAFRNEPYSDNAPVGTGC